MNYQSYVLSLYFSLQHTIYPGFVLAPIARNFYVTAILYAITINPVSQAEFSWNSRVDRAIIARNKEGVRGTTPFNEAEALSGRLVPFINGTIQVYAVHVREDEVDDERRPSAMVRGSLSRFTIIVQNDMLAQSKKKKRERKRKKEEEGSVQANRSFLFPCSQNGRRLNAILRQ